MAKSAQKNTVADRSLVHDLRTPLTSLKSCLEILRTGQSGPLTADQERFLDLARRNLDRLAELADGILACDVTAQGQRQIDLASVLTETVELHRPAAVCAGQTLDVGGVPESFIARTDPATLCRLLDNIVGNAIRHAGTGALIRVWLEPRPRPENDLALALARHSFLPLDFFTVVIEDSGPGLPEGVRVPAPNPTAARGLGIASNLAAELGGQLRLATGTNGGATAWIRLPRCGDSARLKSCADRLQDRMDRGQGRLVILDLRDGPGAAEIHADRVRKFIARETNNCADGGEELTPGLWAAVVASRERWAESWARFTWAHADNMVETTWDAPIGTAMGNDQAPQETFNPEPVEPIRNT